MTHPLPLIQQVLQKRLQAMTVRLESEVCNGGVAREAEDTVNELQRLMGDFAWSINDHRRMLEMSRRLQQAMQEVRTTSISPQHLRLVQ